MIDLDAGNDQRIQIVGTTGPCFGQFCLFIQRVLLVSRWILLKMKKCPYKNSQIAKKKESERLE